MEVEGKISIALGAIALVLLVIVSLGVVYLTAVEWRDRRRRKREELDTKKLSKNTKNLSKK